MSEIKPMCQMPILGNLYHQRDFDTLQARIAELEAALKGQTDWNQKVLVDNAATILLQKDMIRRLADAIDRLPEDAKCKYHDFTIDEAHAML